VAIKINHQLTPQKLLPRLNRLFELSAGKILDLERTWQAEQGTPVFTAKGRYTSRGWTEWTQGFQFGSALLQFDATDNYQFLELGHRQTMHYMAPHVSHVGVHDHGFNNISTYGNLLRLLREGRFANRGRGLRGLRRKEKGDLEEGYYAFREGGLESEGQIYELALKVSGAVQAARWTNLGNGEGYVYSFNGPHSLFIDTIRSLRSLAVAHQLGHVLMGEGDQKISLLQRLLAHARITAKYAIYYGEGRDAYDVRGRTAHESLFNVTNGSYRCPNSQQGYSPFSTWTRGLAWAICGFAEELEFLASRPAEELVPFGGRRAVLRWMLEAATAAADFYLANTPACGVPYWDTGAPYLHRLGDYLDRPADPFNPWEPVDSSAAAIAAQGLIRLGNYLTSQKNGSGTRYRQAGLTVAQTLLDEPYLSTEPGHQGLLLHSVYHRPNGWDYVRKGQKVPNGESSMWGDYHARELGLLLLREARAEPYLTFFGGARSQTRSRS
jgi:unsaturated chondroitin disaccharide hydrolase